MKLSVRDIVFTGVIAIMATASMSAQTSNSWFEQWYRAKYGRASSTEQARLNSQPVNTASAPVVRLLATNPANNSFEQRFRAKAGRPSPTEEASLHAAQVNSVLPGEAQTTVAPVVDNGFEHRYQVKYGRPSPIEEARLEQSSSGPSIGQLNTMITTAKTPVEQERIAKVYQSQAQHYLALSKEHETMLAAYESQSGLVNSKNQASTINHCTYLVEKFNGLAAKSSELAQLHERLATEAASR